MEEIGEGHHEDVMRAFFRHRVGDIGRLIRKVTHITTQAAHATGKDISEFLPEANRIVLVGVLVLYLKQLTKAQMVDHPSICI